MKLINDIVYLDFAELRAAGIADGTIKSATYRRSWEFINDPSDKRKALVRYETLPAGVKAIVDSFYTPDVLTYLRKAGLEAMLPDSTEALNFYRAYRLHDGTGLGIERISAYTQAARYCQLIASVSAAGGVSKLKQIGLSKAEFYAAVVEAIKKQELALPATYKKLMEKVAEFKASSYVALVSKRFGNTSAEKLNDEQKNWLIARAGQTTKPDTVKMHRELMALSALNGWPQVTERCCQLFLNRPEVMPVWYLGRHGVEMWKNKFEHHAKLAAPSFRDSIWCSDGSKLNFFYRDENGKVSSAQQMYFVTDVYSEIIIGWSISRSENYATVVSAYKKAIQFSQAKPYQILYDNGGAHNSKEQQEFFKRLSNAHFPAKPYNGQSKPIESIIGRFQKQVMRDLWFFTGQNITSRTDNSTANLAYIRDNAKSLPTLEQVTALMADLVNTWNSAKHPKHSQTRIELYQQSVSPVAQPVDYLDMVDLFWLYAGRELTYRRGGISITVHGQQYEYEVLGENNQPDVTWINAHVLDKFIVAYDPEDMTHVRLYQRFGEELRFVSAATQKAIYPRALADFDENTSSEIRTMLNVRNEQQKAIRERLETATEMSGIASEQEVAYKLLFGKKEDVITAEDSYVITQMSLYADGAKASLKRIE
jgi:hypothetical protein